MISIIGIIKQPNRFNVMDFRCMVDIIFMHPTRLAGMGLTPNLASKNPVAGADGGG